MNKYHYYKKYLLFLGALIFSIGCEYDSEHGHDHPHATDMSHSDQEHEHDEVILTDAQMKSIGLTTGSFTSLIAGETVKSNGVLDVPPEEVADISVPSPAFIKKINEGLLLGNYVKEGTVMAEVTHPDFLKIQLDYQELIAETAYKELEVERQKKLAEANAGSLKALQSAESDLQILEARKSGTRAQMNYLGIDPTIAENGSIQQNIRIKAPISGYITVVNIHQGKFVQPAEVLYEIVNTSHIHVELDIFENDVSKVKEGQKITFVVPALGGGIHEGVVKLISRNFNMNNKTVRVHGHIEHNDENASKFIRGLYVDAQIHLQEEMINALPFKAVVSAEGLDYIFYEVAQMEGHNLFKQVKVKTGLKQGGFVQVIPIDPIPEGVKIVTSEAFYLLSEMRKEEFEHSH